MRLQGRLVDIGGCDHPAVKGDVIISILGAIAQAIVRLQFFGLYGALPPLPLSLLAQSPPSSAQRDCSQAERKSGHNVFLITAYTTLNTSTSELSLIDNLFGKTLNKTPLFCRGPSNGAIFS